MSGFDDHVAGGLEAEIARGGERAGLDVRGVAGGDVQVAARFKAGCGVGGDSARALVSLI